MNPLVILVVIGLGVAALLLLQPTGDGAQPVRIRPWDCAHGTFYVQSLDGIRTPHCIVPSPSPPAQARR